MFLNILKTSCFICKWLGLGLGRSKNSAQCSAFLPHDTVVCQAFDIDDILLAMRQAEPDLVLYNT